MNSRNSFFSTFSRLLTLLAGVTSLAVATQAADYDAARDFSLAVNPNGVWSYGYVTQPGGSFVLLGAQAVSPSDEGIPVPSWQYGPAESPSVHCNTSSVPMTVGFGTTTVEAGAMYFVPGEPHLDADYCVVRFTVPAGGAGSYDLAVAVTSLYVNYFAGDTDFHVFHNNVELAGQFLPPVASTSFAATLNLRAGDTVDFVVGPGSDGSNVGSILKLTALLDGPDASISEALQELQELIASLPRGGSRWLRPILATLNAAKSSLEHGNVEAARAQLHAAQAKVRASLTRKDPDLAAALVEGIQRVLNHL